MRKAAVFAFMLLCSACLAADYQLFYENGKAGLRNESGQVILPATFDALGWTDGSFSIVGQVTGYRAKGKWGLINLNKQLITKAEYESLTSSGADRVVASKWINPFTQKFGCLDLSGRITVPFLYDGISIHGLRAIVFIKDGPRYNYGLIDLNDKGILPLRYREIRMVGTLRLAVQNFDKKTALFSEEGTQLTNFDIDSISAFRKGKAIVYQNFKQGLINREGAFEIEPELQEVRVTSDGTTEIKPYDEWKLIASNRQDQEKVLATQLQPNGNQYLISLLNKYGLVDKNLRPLLPLQYDYLSPFENGIAVAAREKKFGLIRKNGKEILPLTYDSLAYEKNFVRAAVRKNGNLAWSVYDTFGICKTPKVYEQLLSYNGKFFPVSNYGFAGAVDRYGKEILTCVYDSLLDHNFSQVLVRFKGQYGIVDYHEKWMLLPQVRQLRLVDDQRYIEVQDSIQFLKTFDGQTIFFSNHPLVYSADENCLIEKRSDGTLQKISLTGVAMTHTPVMEEVTEKVLEESEGYRGILRDGRYGFVDSRNRLRIANRYEAIGRFKDGVAPVRILGRWGFVNKEDKIAINPSYERVEEFEQGISIVQRNGKMGFIDKTGDVIMPFRYDSIYRSSGLMVLVQEGKMGLSDKKGNVLIDPRFEEIQILPRDRVLVRAGDQWGLLTYDGLSLLPPVYDHLIYQPETDGFLAHKKSQWVKRGS